MRPNRQLSSNRVRARQQIAIMTATIAQKSGEYNPVAIVEETVSYSYTYASCFCIEE